MTTKAGDSAKKKQMYKTNNDKADLKTSFHFLFSLFPLIKKIIQPQCGIIAGERCKNE